MSKKAYENEFFDDLTPDTQPEPIQEEEAGAAAADLDKAKETAQVIAKALFDLLENQEFWARQNALEDIVYIEAAKKFTSLSDEQIFELSQAPAQSDNARTALEEFLDLNLTDDQKQFIDDTLDHFEPGEEATPEEVARTFINAIQRVRSQPETTQTRARPTNINILVDKASDMLAKTFYKSKTPSGQLTLAPIDLSDKKNQLQDYNVIFTIQNLDKEASSIKSSSEYAYEEMVMLIANAYYQLGRKIISVYDIWKTLYGSRKNSAEEDEKKRKGNIKPSQDQLARIRDALTLMDNTFVYCEISKPNKEKTRIRGRYLEYRPIQEVDANGEIINEKIWITEEPLLIQMAKTLNNLSSVSLNLLTGSPIDKTENNLRVQRYLVRLIKRWKNAKSKGRPQNTQVTYKKIFEECSITDKSTRSRMKGRIKTLLDYFKTEDGERLITDYKIDGDKIIITL